MKYYSRYSHYFNIKSWTAFPIERKWKSIWHNGGSPLRGLFKEEIENWLSEHHGDTYIVWYDSDQNQHHIAFSSAEDATIFMLKFG